MPRRSFHSPLTWSFSQYFLCAAQILFKYLFESNLAWSGANRLETKCRSSVLSRDCIFLNDILLLLKLLDLGSLSAHFLACGSPAFLIYAQIPAFFLGSWAVCQRQEWVEVYQGKEAKVTIRVGLDS